MKNFVRIVMSVLMFTYAFQAILGKTKGNENDIVKTLPLISSPLEHNKPLGKPASSMVKLPVEKRDWSNYDTLAYEVINSSDALMDYYYFIRGKKIGVRNIYRNPHLEPGRLEKVNINISRYDGINNITGFNIFQEGKLPVSNKATFSNIRLVAYKIKPEKSRITNNPFTKSTEITVTLSRPAKYKIGLLKGGTSIVNFEGEGRTINKSWDQKVNGKKVPGIYVVKLLITDPLTGKTEPSLTIGKIKVRKRTPDYILTHKAPGELYKYDDNPDAGTFITKNNIELGMAKNERESFQIGFYPNPKKSLKGKKLNIKIGEFINDTGEKLSADLFKSYQEMFIKEKDKKKKTELSGYFPRPLLETSEIIIEDNKVQPIWIACNTKEETKAGNYKGTITVKVEGCKSQKFNVSLKVYNFVIPKKKTAWVLSDMFRTPLNNLYKDSEINIVDIWGRFCNTMLEYGFNPPGIYVGMKDLACGKRGHHKANAEKAKEYLDKGANAICVAYIKGKEKYSDKSRDYLFKDIGEKVKALRDAGVEDKDLYFYGYDETHISICKEEMNRIFSKLKKLYPNIKTVTTCREPTFGLHSKMDCVDIWSTHFDRNIELAKERAKTANVQVFPYNGPSLRIDSALSSRKMWWHVYSSEAKGWLLYVLNNWTEKHPLKPQKYCNWEVRKANDIAVIYGDEKGNLVPTIAFENLRDGIEDYEYLILLEKKVGKEKAMEYLKRLEKANWNTKEKLSELKKIRSEIAEKIAK